VRRGGNAALLCGDAVAPKWHSKKTELLFVCSATRNRALNSLVIASAAKQSSFQVQPERSVWIASSLSLLAMTRKP
jgi:hypothetical protein